jgi:hypothetical protein
VSTKIDPAMNGADADQPDLVNALNALFENRIPAMYLTPTKLSSSPAKTAGITILSNELANDSAPSISAQVALGLADQIAWSMLTPLRSRSKRFAVVVFDCGLFRRLAAEP